MSVRPPRVLALMILACAACAALLAPAFASGAATQFGSSLAPGPAGAFGCSVKPSLYDYSGNFGLFTNAEPGGCTWSQAGVWGLNSSGDPRARSVPGDGRITGAEILSGSNPSPLWITVIRQLAQPGVGNACCFFRSDTGPFPLTPNGVTTIPLDIPVERNTKEGVLGVDLMSVSAETDAGSLPLRVVGPSNVLSIPDGNPMAGVFYPRMGRIANDVNGGRHEIQEGVPGYELLVRWTFCATGDVTCAGAAPGTGGGAVVPVTPTAGPKTPTAGPKALTALAPRLGAKQAQVEEGKALVGLVCGGNAACEGRLSLLAQAAGASAAGKKPATVLYGAADYKISAGAKRTVSVKLNARGKKLLKKHASATVTLRLAPKGGKATTATLSLTRAADKPH